MWPREVARLVLPTPFGPFDLVAFGTSENGLLLALVLGDVGDGDPVLVRIHSECLTGDVLGSLRCDCGVQLRDGMRAIAAQGRGVLVYATGHEGRGIGLLNKLKAYMEQDRGADTVDANLRLGLPVDRRDFTQVTRVLVSLGVRKVRLMSNNPAKVKALEDAGLDVIEVTEMPFASSRHNLRYLSTKTRRMNHGGLATSAPKEIFAAPVDVSGLIGGVEAREDRPAVVLKYAQTADGRIATASGDSKWISGEEERVVSHCLRARADAVMVGIGTVLRDDPQLTVRMVSGASPIRVILDSKLEVPLDARVLDRDAHTVVVTTGASDPEKRRVLESEGVGVRMVAQERSGVSLPETMRALRSMGIETLLVEGGASVITSLLRERLVDRLVVSISPLLIGRGTDAVGDLAVGRVDEGIRLKGQTVYGAGNDILIAWDVASSGAGAPGSD